MTSDEKQITDIPPTILGLGWLFMSLVMLSGFTVLFPTPVAIGVALAFPPVSLIAAYVLGRVGIVLLTVAGVD